MRSLGLALIPNLSVVVPTKLPTTAVGNHPGFRRFGELALLVRV